MTAELAVRDNVTEIARPSSGLALSFEEMTTRVAQLDQFYRQVMQEGTDYGKIPGTDKPTLYQPGAQMLDQIFGYCPTFEVAPTSRIDWDRQPAFFHYIIVCRLVSRRSGEVVAEGIGSCNSHEDKYRWRTSKRRCPSCNAEAIIKGKQEYGGGWICFKKNGGCGAKYRDGDAAVEGQSAGRVENEDSASLENTVSKMAQKRAHIAATLNATGASRIFTQDIEDLPQFQNALRVEAVVVPSATPADVEDHFEDQSGRQMIREMAAQRQPAGPRDRAKFEDNWTKGVARAVACGIAPDDKPGPNATSADLGKAQRELLQAIQAREKLNAELASKIAAVRAAGGDIADMDPTTCTDTEIHESISSLNEMLSPSADDDADDEMPF